MVVPQKSSANQRVYRRAEVENLFVIKKLLYEEKYSIGGVRAKLAGQERERYYRTRSRRDFANALKLLSPRAGSAGARADLAPSFIFRNRSKKLVSSMLRPLLDFRSWSLIPAAASARAWGMPFLPYTTRTHQYSAWGTTVQGDLSTLGMAGAEVGLG